MWVIENSLTQTALSLIGALFHSPRFRGISRCSSTSPACLTSSRSCWERASRLSLWVECWYATTWWPSAGWVSFPLAWSACYPSAPCHACHHKPLTGKVASTEDIWNRLVFLPKAFFPPLKMLSLWFYSILIHLQLYVPSSCIVDIIDSVCNDIFPENMHPVFIYPKKKTSILPYQLSEKSFLPSKVLETTCREYVMIAMCSHRINTSKATYCFRFWVIMNNDAQLKTTYMRWSDIVVKRGEILASLFV